VSVAYSPVHIMVLKKLMLRLSIDIFCTTTRDVFPRVASTALSSLGTSLP
jgi:hypothetical protein